MRVAEPERRRVFGRTLNSRRGSCRSTVPTLLAPRRTMKTQLDMRKIATGLRGGEKVTSAAGYFGAMQVLAEVRAQLRPAAGRDRPTDMPGRSTSCNGKT